jgi:hypothetical protein
MSENTAVKLSASDHGANTLRAIVKGLPWIGATLEQVAFGPADERRWRRVERTLEELGEMMQERGVSPESVGTEEFAELLGAVAPDISTATNEDKRHRLRDLLLNAAQLPSMDRDWESAKLAASWLKRVDGPGLALLATLAGADAFEGDNAFEILGVIRGRGAPIAVRPATSTRPELTLTLPYEWAVVNTALDALERLGLIEGHGIGQSSWQGVRLTPHGSFLVHWAIAAESTEEAR